MNTNLGGTAAAAADQSFRPWGAAAGAATIRRPAKTPPLTACCRWWPGVSSGVGRHAVLWSNSRCASLGVTGRRISEVSCSSSSSSDGGGNGTRGLTYKDAGVDIDAGAELVRRIAKMAPGIGGFGGLFPLGILINQANPLDPDPVFYVCWGKHKRSFFLQREMEDYHVAIVHIPNLTKLDADMEMRNRGSFHFLPIVRPIQKNCQFPMGFPGSVYHCHTVKEIWSFMFCILPSHCYALLTDGFRFVEYDVSGQKHWS